MTLSAGLRAETRSADYADSDGAAFAPDDTMLGGHLSLRGGPRRCGRAGTSRPAAATRPAASTSGSSCRRIDGPSRPSTCGIWRQGCASLRRDAAVEGELAVFHMWRDDQQVATSFQVDPGDPLSYIFLTDNAASGRNYGLEAEVAWQPRRRRCGSRAPSGCCTPSTSTTDTATAISTDATRRMRRRGSTR